MENQQQAREAAQPEAAPETAKPEEKQEARPEPQRKPLLDEVTDETLRREMDKLAVDSKRIEHKQRLAKMFAASGVFEGWEEKKQVLSPEQRLAQAMVKIMLGEAAGMTEVEAMQSIYLVKGRPSIASEVRAARMKRAGYYWVFRTRTDKGCSLIPCHRNNAPVSLPNGSVIHPFVNERGEMANVEFVEADAKRAGLVPAKEDSNWSKYPTDMYSWRALSRMQRFYAPEVLNGANLLDRDEAIELSGWVEDRPGSYDAAQEAGAQKLAAMGVTFDAAK